MTLDDFLFKKLEVFERLRLMPSSRSQSTLLHLLKLSNHDLLTAAVDSWFEFECGSRPFKTTIKVPLELLPEATTDISLYFSDLLKRSIKL
jgi:hypothetical protein